MHHLCLPFCAQSTPHSHVVYHSEAIPKPHQVPREGDIRLNQMRSSENTDESRVSQDEETGGSEYDGRNTFPTQY